MRLSKKKIYRNSGNQDVIGLLNWDISALYKILTSISEGFLDTNCCTNV